VKTNFLPVGIPGFAYPLYAKSREKKTFDSILGQDPRVRSGRPGNLQVVLAIKGGKDAQQCKKCRKYFTTRKAVYKHVRNIQDCHLSVYRFATIDGLYFCYLDGRRFTSSLQLLYHLGAEHHLETEKLRAWGFDLKAVVAQASTMGVAEGKRAMERACKKKQFNEEVRRQAIEVAKRLKKE